MSQPEFGCPKVLILGADGFIGRHIAFFLRRKGWRVVTSSRRCSRLAQMGFETLTADLCNPATHDAAFWKPHLVEVDHVIVAAGLLNGSEEEFQSVHISAPEALYAARPKDCSALLISAVGIDVGYTLFARYRRLGETLAQQHNATILRPGLVLGVSSYGGSSLARALSALPWITPVVGSGNQQFNPIHADDLATLVHDCLRRPPGPGAHEVGGPETISQAEMLGAFRAWLGLPPARLLHLPRIVARGLGRIGDWLRLGPISRTAVDQLNNSVLAKPDEDIKRLPTKPLAFSEFHTLHPAGTQDLWHARLYLMRPLLRISLAFLWLVSGVIGLTLPANEFLPLVGNATLSESVLIALARFGGLVDIAIGLALIRAMRLRMLAGIQFMVILAYTAAFTVLAQWLWLLPLGGLLKNVPLLVLIAIHGILEEER